MRHLHMRHMRHLHIKVFGYFAFAISLLLLMGAPLRGHTYKLPVIIDSDMGLDDARALVLLFNQDMCDIRLMVASDGAVSPSVGAANMGIIGAHFNAGDVPVAIGKRLNQPAPPWREWSEKIFSGQKGGAKKRPANGTPFPSAAQSIVKTLMGEETPCIYLCLGPMTNLAEALELDGRIKKNISRVIYYGTPPLPKGNDWNTARDVEAVKGVFNSGLRIYTLKNPAIKNPVFGASFFEKITGLNTPASAFLVGFHGGKKVRELLKSDHFRIWDELAVIFLNRPDLFSFEQRETGFFMVSSFGEAEIKKSYLKLLGHSADSHLLEREVVVLNGFPTAETMFKPDVAPFVKKIIEVHGMEEWKACLLTNELHRHLGLYSIIGAKMGIRAREILEAPLDGLKVVSYAGGQPPMSCLNDGLQVSTGASLGRGTIAVPGNAPGESRPEVDFIYKDRKVRLKLKGEVVSLIKAEIGKMVKQYGGVNEAYFKAVRKMAVRYWLELDRRHIFEEISVDKQDK